MVSPVANVEHEAGAHVTGAQPSTASGAAAEKETIVPAEVGASATTDAGSVRTGGVVSTTVNVAETVRWFPALSLTSTEIVEAPTRAVSTRSQTPRTTS